MAYCYYKTVQENEWELMGKALKEEHSSSTNGPTPRWVFFGKDILHLTTKNILVATPPDKQEVHHLKIIMTKCRVSVFAFATL